MKRNVIIIAAALVAILLILRFGRPQGRGEAPKGPAPQFSLVDLNNQPLSPAAYKGKVLVVNFWATWCGPCRHEMPELADLQKRYADKGVQIVGLAVDSGDKASVTAYVSAHPVTYPIALADDNVTNLFGGVDSLPTTFIIGRDGSLQKRIAGADVPAVEQAVQKLL